MAATVVCNYNNTNGYTTCIHYTHLQFKVARNMFTIITVQQTAFDCPDVTGAVFKSRLDQMKTNIRNGKYFSGRELTYRFHVIEH